jgi:addiction module HigA family antidote
MAEPKKLPDPMPPGEILLEEFMSPLGVSINRLARDIGVPPNRISGIVNGKRSITADTALRLGKYFGTSAETWLDLHSDYDLRRIPPHGRGRDRGPGPRAGRVDRVEDGHYRFPSTESLHHSAVRSLRMP